LAGVVAVPGVVEWSGWGRRAGAKDGALLG
jgi:hypothetical protein